MTSKRDHANGTEKKSREIGQRILSWYTRHRRDLPWRKTKNPYHIWVSEIMLQQTQVDTVIPYYHHFLSSFPTIQALAEASLDDVLKVWENLGYYARARHLHQAAQKIVKTYGGKLPRNHDALVTLPGIGEYTAGAIRSIAFNIACAAVDANIRRVVSRLFAVGTPLDKRSTQRKISDLAQDMILKKAPGEVNQGLMDLGATICTPTGPSCGNCPLHRWCEAFSKGLQEKLPVIKKRPPIPHHHTTAAVITDKRNRILLVQRPNHGLLGGLWKFPGGKKRQKETLVGCLKRTVEEELGISIQTGKEIAQVKHTYTHFRITLHAFTCAIKSGKPKAVACHAWRWSTPPQWRDLALSKADRKIMEAMNPFIIDSKAKERP
jgi:A/G-specific adenine glycosylase